MTVPTEEQEGIALANWLRGNNYAATHIGNEAGQSGTRNIIIMMNRKKRLGVSKGFPDYCIVLKRGSLLFIELKRQKKLLKNGKLGASPSKITDEQIEWINTLGNIDNVEAHICYGCEESIKLIQELEQL